MKPNATFPSSAIKHLHKTHIAKLVALTLLSFLLPQTHILGGISPFTVAMLSALPAPYTFLCSFGALLGFLSGGLTQDGILQLLVIGLILTGKMWLRHKEMAKTMLFDAAFCFVCSAVVVLCASLWFSFTTTDLLLRLCESAIAGGICCFLHIATHALLFKKSLRQFTSIEMGALSILVLLFVLALCSVQIYQFHLGVIFGVVGLYLVIQTQGLMGGAVGSIMLSFALCLYSLSMVPICAILIVAGFFAGIFYKTGKIGQVAVFNATSVFAVFIMGVNLSVLFSLMEILIASLLYLSLSEKMMRFVALPQMGVAAVDADHALKHTLENKLNFAADTIRDLQRSLKTVSKKIDVTTVQDISELYNQTAATVCQSCGLKLGCWDDHYNETVDAFQKLTKILKQQQLLTEQDVKALPQLNCCRSGVLAQTLQQNYNNYYSKQKIMRYVGEVRSVAIEQFAGLSQMLCEMGEEIASIQTIQVDTAKSVSELFEMLVRKPESVSCVLNHFGRMELEIHVQGLGEFHEQELCESLSNCCQRDFALPTISKIANRTRLSFYEKPTLLVEYSAYQINSNHTEDEEVCGDSYEVYRDDKGHIYFIFSDGMGSGKQAAMDSTMTCGIVVKLLKAGFMMDSIIKFVHTCLQLKSKQESFATIDVAKVDLYTGQVEFFKAGSASSYLVMGSTIAKVTTTSLPVGIIPGLELDKKTYLLHENDHIALVSDGVMELGEEKIIATLRKHKHLSCERLSKQLCVQAAATIESHDDLTALVVKLTEGV